MATTVPRKSLVGNNYFGLADLLLLDQDVRPVSPSDPGPIEIKSEPTGPFHWSPNSVICTHCGSIIRENYLPAHRSTGACQRNIQKQAQDQTIPPRPPRRSG